jgi:hypothetical protein
VRVPSIKSEYGLLGIGVLGMLIGVGKVIGALMLWTTSVLGFHPSYASQPIAFVAVVAFWTAVLVMSFCAVKDSIAAMGTRRRNPGAGS